jgi:glyoxylate utilization-related uncharacterized protein
MSKKDNSIIIVAITIIILGAFFYYKNAHAPVVTQNQALVAPVSTFAPTAFSGFPTELVPAGGSTPQYFDNAASTGAIFLIKKSVMVAEADYEKQIKGTDWSIANKVVNTNGSRISLANTKTKITAEVQINPISGTASTMIISIKK